MASDPQSIAVLAEKPSVARDIARVLGANAKGDGFLHGNGYIVTWAIGHLAALAQPHEINPQWKQWRRYLLPMLPDRWPLVVYEKTKDQFETVRQILNSPKVSRIVCATDAGREGELIFRYIYEAAGCQKPVSRLWISSLTPDAIRKGFEKLRPGDDYDSLGDAARGRSRADWLVGMNLSRAYTLAYDEDLSVGRVQTPTLAMLVDRELAIRRFVPEDYLEVVATFHPTGAAKSHSYQGTWFRRREANTATESGDKASLQQAMRLPPDGEEARAIADRARTGQAAIESVEARTQRAAPPPLYDLTELQRHANRLFGFTAQHTLDIAQALYERHKLISYPRTDSRHLSNDVARTLPRVVETIADPYRDLLAPGTGQRPLGRAYVDDAKVTDHHAIIPTVTPPGRANLTADERKIYDLVCRRLLSAWHDDHIWNVTTVITAIRNGETVDRYYTTGSAVKQIGWKVLEIAPAKAKKPAKGEGTEEQVLPPGLAPGQPQDVTDVEVQRKRTRPPKRLTEGTLLTAMETAGKTLDEKELSDAMKETGLGTPATRASIIEVLLKREYIVRDGKSLQATDKGIHLIEVVHPEVKTPAMTGQWEAYLHRIHRGSAQLTPFIHGIEQYVREVVGKVGQVTPPPRRDRGPGEQSLLPGSPRHAAPIAPSANAKPHAEASIADSPGRDSSRRAPLPTSSGSLFADHEPPPGKRESRAASERSRETLSHARQDSLFGGGSQTSSRSGSASLFDPPSDSADRAPDRREGRGARPIAAPDRAQHGTQHGTLFDTAPAYRAGRGPIPASSAEPPPPPDDNAWPELDASSAPPEIPDDAAWPELSESTAPPPRPLGSLDPSGWLSAGGPSKPAAKRRPSIVPANAPAALSGLPADIPQAHTGPLGELLHSAFGFATFRNSQEEVCRAVIGGRDVLLVMPTGAGKSLCYQLPGIARGGTTLVISPLIALMEDQVGKLKQRGFAVECIHSGRERAASRQACLDYLAGTLRFLFIAPERMRVPGFPEMLAKRKPSLIAIDEAHCISQWGHDFRPDYRTLGQHLPNLRPSPVIALTATATPIVQNDIAEQLGLIQPERFIQGFRRSNLAVEAIEVAPKQRGDLTMELLDDPARRPAIVYTPTRAQATDVAMLLRRRFPADAYHAGLDAEHRKRVQEEFLEGRIQVMVATIAFGMGIDKPDVRTVIHTALPASLESYYQEIGRAGRDGLPSRTILMHSYADRHTHDFFFDRDYPSVDKLDAIFSRLRNEPVEKAALQHQVRLGPDTFDKALEKLWIHGGALVDFAENVSRGNDNWREPYRAQSEQKKQQLEMMLRFAESSECRMAALVRHFGDLADARNACGTCDFCAPEDCVGQRFREPNHAELTIAMAVVDALREGPRATGRLYSETCPHGDPVRDDFEELLGAMARANFVRLANETFEKDGRSIPFRKAWLTRDGEELEEIVAGDLRIKTVTRPSAKSRKGKKQTEEKKQKPSKRKRAARGAEAPTSVPAGKRTAKPVPNAVPGEETEAPAPAAASKTEERLRAWRLAEAKRRGVPAFRIFSDQVLRDIAARRPATAAELLAIHGLGLATVEKYGAHIFRLMHEG